MLLMLGKDGVIHTCSEKNTKYSLCDESIPSVRVNPDFKKLRNIIWCYECSAMYEDYEIEMNEINENKDNHENLL